MLEQHSRAVAIIHIIMGALGLLGAIVVLAVFLLGAGAATMSGDPDAPAAAFFSGTCGTIIAVLIVYGIGQVLESFVLTPFLVGERIGLHPLAVIFALMAFGQLFGFFGVLLAIPASAALLVGLRHLKRQLD